MLTHVEAGDEQLLSGFVGHDSLAGSPPLPLPPLYL